MTAYDELVAGGAINPRRAEHGLDRAVMRKIMSTAQGRAKTVLVNRYYNEYRQLYEEEVAALIAKAQSA